MCDIFDFDGDGKVDDLELALGLSILEDEEDSDDDFDDGFDDDSDD